jgi:small-conductance mechanosensitive channel/CRP-like cAMP-binding protein
MNWLDEILKLLDTNLKLGSLKFTLLDLIEFFVLVTVVLIVATIVRRLFLSRVLARTGISPALQKMIARFAGYVVIVIGLFVSFQILGINLGSLAFLAGAFGLGLGFGLQNIISNFVSGLIILIEQPILVGDRIDVGGVEGDVVEINARATKIVTNDNITIIVPNSEFISSRVINWSHGDPKVRFRIPVGVSYGSDPRLIEQTLLEVADEADDVLKHPPPVVRFMSYGDNALNFELRVWTDTLVHQKNKLISDINFRIFERFHKYGIEIPFPQRDVHIKHMPAQGQQEPEAAKETAASHLRDTSLFRSLDDEEIAQLVEKAQLRKFRRDEKIIRQGEEGDSLFLILKGVVRLDVEQTNAPPVRITRLGRGDFFGERSLLTGDKRSATVIAESAVDTVEMFKACLQPVLEKDPSIAEELSRALEAHEKQFKERTQSNQPEISTERHRAQDASGILTRIRSFFRLR